MKLWMPTRPSGGEGCTGREEPGAGSRHSSTNEHLIRSTGVVNTACREGDLGEVGEARDGWEDPRLQTSPEGRRPVWESERAIGPMRPGNAGGGKGPYF